MSQGPTAVQYVEFAGTTIATVSSDSFRLTIDIPLNPVPEAPLVQIQLSLIPMIPNDCATDTNAHLRQQSHD